MSKKMYFVWGLFVIVLLACFLYIGFKTDNNYKAYYSLESNLEEAASMYFTQNPFTLEEGESMKVDINDLSSYVDDLKVKGDKCSGYVLISKKDGKNTYKTYLTCEKYKSLKE